MKSFWIRFVLQEALSVLEAFAVTKDPGMAPLIPYIEPCVLSIQNLLQAIAAQSVSSGPTPSLPG